MSLSIEKPYVVWFQDLKPGNLAVNENCELKVSLKSYGDDDLFQKFTLYFLDIALVLLQAIWK